ncbi:MAG: transglycosylase SLT domain-containing protein [Chloroflexi bacterium]|nr:transglycosylase SLT domain-containing protein [Chloroflexota bacterium]
MKQPTTNHTRTKSKENNPAKQRRFRLRSPRWLGLAIVLLVLCGLMGFTGAFTGAALVLPEPLSSVTIVDTNLPFYATSAIGPQAAQSTLSPVFTDEVRYWEPMIRAWALMYEVDPNVIATLIQIESCGDPTVASHAGAQGLFQVMPFHFQPGEDMLDVQTNATRGMNYLSEGLVKADGHVGLALAGYNGGHGVINRGWATWHSETKRYYEWGSQIYAEAVSGAASSPALQDWLNAGGQSLCNRARDTQGRLELQYQQQVTNQPAAVAAAR